MRLLTVLLLLFVVTACGQMGPLYLPEENLPEESLPSTQDEPVSPQP